MFKPSEYKHIRAWGKLLRSYDYYIELEQHRASENNAPINAVYDKGDNDWVTADTCQPDTQESLERWIKENV